MTTDFKRVVGELAYKLWQQDGSPEGSDLHYWFTAEKQITAEINKIPSQFRLASAEIAEDRARRQVVQFPDRWQPPAA